MSSASEQHPSGTKVNLGNDAPTRQEAAGVVAQDSLAAESYRAGGEFANNRGAEPEKFNSSDEIYDAKMPRSHKIDTAPSHVDNVLNSGAGKPHGKNITEDENIVTADTRDGLKRALRSEPGSMDDPSRGVEYKMSSEGQGVTVDGSNNMFHGLDRKTDD